MGTREPGLALQAYEGWPEMGSVGPRAGVPSPPAFGRLPSSRSPSCVAAFPLFFSHQRQQQPGLGGGGAGAEAAARSGKGREEREREEGGADGGRLRLRLLSSLGGPGDSGGSRLSRALGASTSLALPTSPRAAVRPPYAPPPPPVACARTWRPRVACGRGVA